VLPCHVFQPRDACRSLGFDALAVVERLHRAEIKSSMIKIWQPGWMLAPAQSDTGLIPTLRHALPSPLLLRVARIKLSQLKEKHIWQYIIPKGTARLTFRPVEKNAIGGIEEVR